MNLLSKVYISVQTSQLQLAKIKDLETKLHLQLQQSDDTRLMMKNKTKEFVENLKNDHNEAMNIQRKQKDEIVQVQVTIVVFLLIDEFNFKSLHFRHHSCNLQKSRTWKTHWSKVTLRCQIFKLSAFI